MEDLFRLLDVYKRQGKDIDLSIPVGALGEGGSEVVEVAPAATTAAPVAAPTAETLATEGKDVYKRQEMPC